MSNQEKILKICKRISDIIQPISKENIEIEIKFRKVSESDYFFLLKYLQNLYDEEKEKTTDYYIKNERISQRGKIFISLLKKCLCIPL